jgi:hypothetical protein
MDNVFELHIEDKKNPEINARLFFESRELAESVYSFLNEVLTDEAKENITVVATAHPVYDAMESVKQILEAFRD